MVTRAVVLFGVGLAALSGACGSANAPASPPILPLRTLRLYETGVGYFERSGTVDSPTSLPVPAGHLDDALKTLVVLDAHGSATVHGIEFPSSMSRGMARAMAGLPVNGDEPLGLEQLLSGLRGARVEVRAHAASYTGRVVDVTQSTPDGVTSKDASAAGEAQGDATKIPRRTTELTLLVLTDKGAIVRMPVTEVDSVRPLDPAYSERLGSALDALSSQGARSEHPLHVLASGPVTLGYVAETPVWRTTYRVLLTDDGRPSVLEGWALLHNDTDEDWRGVHVELANGRPDSFLFPLAAPRYARRQLVTPDDQLATVPQLMGTTVDAIYGDHIDDAMGSEGLSISGVGEGGGGSGYGFGRGSLGTVGHGAGSVGSSSLLDVGNLASSAPASGNEAGALFVYALPDKVDLSGHSSALVPFLQQPVEARAIAWLDAAGSPARSAIRFVNSTAQTLPAGTMAFFAHGGFAGESAIPRLKPGERQFVSFGMDLDVEVDTLESHYADETKRLVWNPQAQMLEEHYLRTTDASYSVENRSGQPRTVVLVMAIDRNATLTGADEVDFDTVASHPLAVFHADARKKADRKVHSVEGLERTTPFVNLKADQLTRLAAAPSLPAPDRAATTDAAAHLKDAEQDMTLLSETKASEAEVEKDLDRLREHMKALAGENGAGGGVNPFAARVLAGEDRLTALRKKAEALDTSAKAKRDAAETALAKLTR